MGSKQAAHWRNSGTGAGGLKMQATYKGQTAGGILKTARIEKMQAGNWEVVVKTKDGQMHIAAIG